MDVDFFGFSRDNIISHVQALRGYFPISQKGRWHSGIHITSFGNEKNGFCPIRNPLSGKIVACNLNFDGSKKDNYFLLKNNLVFPTKDGNEKIDFYSLITHLSDYSFFEKIKNKNIFTDLEDEDYTRIFNQPDMPFCYRMTLKTDVEKCKYFEIPKIGYLSEFSEIYVNKTKTLIGKNGNTSPYINTMNIEFSKENSKYKLFDDFVSGYITVNKNTVLERKNANEYEVNSMNLTTNTTLEKKFGFTEVATDKIENGGYCLHKNCDNTFYSISDNLMNYYSNICLIKEQSETILYSVLCKINVKIQNKKNQLEDMKKQASLALYTKNVEKELNQLIEEKKIITTLREKYKSRGLVVFNGPYMFQHKITKEVGIKLTINKNLSAVYIASSFFYPNSDIKPILKKYEIPFFDTFEKCYALVAENIPEPYSLQLLDKIPNKNKDLIKKVIPDSSTVLYECRLHLVQNWETKYTLQLNIPDEKLFYQTNIGSLLYTECGVDKRSYVYSTKELTKINNKNYYTHYYEPSIDWVSKEYEVLNFSEILKEYSQKKDNEDILCQISYGYVPIKKSKLNIKLQRKIIDSKEVSSNNDFIGISLGKNELLSYMKKDDFIDWSIFLTDNILSKESDLWKVNIKKTDNVKCEKRKGRNKLITTFFPINTLFEFDKESEGNDYRKINKISFIVYAYDYDNNSVGLKNNICQDTIGRIFFYGSQIWLKDKKLEFFKTYTNSEGTKINTLAKFNDQNPGCKIAKEGDENYLKLESFLKAFILGADGIFGQKFNVVQGQTYRECILSFSADEICNKLEIEGPIYISEQELKSLDKSMPLTKGGLFNLYSDDNDEIIKCDLPKDINFEYKKNSVSFEDHKFTFDHENEKYQISETDFNKYSKNYIEEYFDSLINLNFKDDKKSSFLSSDSCPDDSLACDLKKLKEELIEKDYFKNKKLLSPNSNLLYNEDKYLSIVSDFNSKIVAYHPLELSEDDHSKIQDLRINNWLVPEWKSDLNDVYKDMSKSYKEKNGISQSSNQFYFVFPPEFLSKMSELKLLKFNPYENKTFQDVYGFNAAAPNVNMNQEIFDNPGFATEHITGDWETNPNTNNYGAVTGFFNQHYPDLGPKYYHEGVDFRGKVGTKVICLIHAKVIAYGWMPDSGYGQSVWLYNVDDEGVYLLAHLSAYDSQIAVGKEYFPGETVAYVGGSGNGKLDRWIPHLHLSYYKRLYIEQNDKDNIIYSSNSKILFGKGYNNEFKNLRRDPFFHNSNGHLGFGK